MIQRVPTNDEMQKMEKNTYNATINQTEINFMPKWIHKMLQKKTLNVPVKKRLIFASKYLFLISFSLSIVIGREDVKPTPQTAIKNSTSKLCWQIKRMTAYH